MHSIRIIGPGRAGTSLAAALSARGWAFAGFLGRHDELARAAEGVDLLVIATPDDAVAEVAAAWTRWPRTRCAPPCTRWYRSPMGRSVPPVWVLASPLPWPERRRAGTW